ncbi:MAG: recombinase family protein, partial [Planctomycetales bacterium]|nr:recombinase family protein [Planctomycetales bacterium]
GASKLVVNEVESKLVQAIYELYLEKQSLVQVTRELAKRGWTTKRWTTRKGRSMGGKPYDKSNLYKLITNALYVGKVRYKDELHDGEHQALVDDDVWQKAQKMLRMNGRNGGSHIRNKYGALLKGLLFCRPCGLAMGHTFTNGQGNRRYRYYTCYTASKRGWDACPSKSLPAEEIEQFVIEQIRTLGNDPTLRSMVLDQIRNAGVEQATAIEGEAGIARREIRQLQAEIKSAAKSAGENSDAAVRLADLHEQLALAETQLVELRNQIVSAENDSISKTEVDAALDEFDPLWDSLSPREQTRALRLLIKRVDYDGGAGKVAITFHANGIETVGSAS